MGGERRSGGEPDGEVRFCCGGKESVIPKLDVRNMLLSWCQDLLDFTRGDYEAPRPARTGKAFCRIIREGRISVLR